MSGIVQRFHDHLCQSACIAVGWGAVPSAVLIDSQSMRILVLKLTWVPSIKLT
jgi:hypothetical protein